MQSSGDNLDYRSRFDRAGLGLVISGLMSLAVIQGASRSALARDVQPFGVTQPAASAVESAPADSAADKDRSETTSSNKPSVDKAEESQSEEKVAEPQPLPKATQETVAAKPEKPAKARIVVRSWAGAYGEAQSKAIITPIARDLGIEIERRTHGGSVAQIDAADVTELDQSSLMAACTAGRLVKMRSLLTPDERDGTASTTTGGDFLVNSVSDCGVPTFAWSSMLIANGEAMKKLAKRRYRVASRLADLLDVKRYPGKRALIRNPKRLLEMMLMGVGVDRDEVYERLATRLGQDDAFRTLDKLSEHVLWVDGPREALLALDQGSVTIAMTYSGRAFRRLIASRLQPIWDGHVIDFASWAVPSSSQNRDKAKRFILAATSARSLAAQARLWPYGPMRRSALPLARRHDLLDADLEEFMPTSDLRLSQGLILSAAFWSKNGVALQRRFDDWLAGVPLGIRVPVPVKAPPAPLPPVPALAKAAAPDIIEQ